MVEYRRQSTEHMDNWFMGLLYLPTSHSTDHSYRLSIGCVPNTWHCSTHSTWSYLVNFTVLGIKPRPLHILGKNTCPAISLLILMATSARCVL